MNESWSKAMESANMIASNGSTVKPLVKSGTRSDGKWFYYVLIRTKRRERISV